jgi:hypothetical protein
MEGYIASQDLFGSAEFKCCAGVTVHSDEASAMADSLRLAGSLSKNQWFRVAIPPEETYLSPALPMSEQPPQVTERLLAAEALSVLFIEEGKLFMRRMEMYLEANGLADNPEAAKTEVEDFYASRRGELLSMHGDGYLSFIKSKTGGGDPAGVSSYLCHFGVSGLAFYNRNNRPAFLLFNPKRDMVIRELRRASLQDSRLVS